MFVTILATLLLFMLISTIAFFVYWNYKKISDINSTYNGTNTDINERLKGIASGVNYNDELIYNKQQTIKDDITDLEADIQGIRTRIATNEGRIAALEGYYQDIQ